MLWINEYDILTDAIEYIKEEIGVDILIHRDDSYDPQNKAKNDNESNIRNLNNSFHSQSKYLLWIP